MVPTEELIEQCIRGDRRAQKQLVEPYLETVMAWVQRLSRPPLDPEDLSHEVFIVALTRISSLRDAQSFRSWLYGITRRTVAKHRKRAWYSRWSASEVEHFADPGVGPSERAEQLHRADQCRRVLERMTAIQREVLILVEVEQRTAAEVASLLDVPEPTVRSRLRLARAAFAKCAESLGLTEPEAHDFESTPARSA